MYNHIDKGKVPKTQIIQLTGHRKVQSLTSYKQPSLVQLEEMSHAYLKSTSFWTSVRDYYSKGVDTIFKVGGGVCDNCARSARKILILLCPEP